MFTCKIFHTNSLSDDKDQTSVKFGVLFSDDRCANIFEALVGTLKAAKKQKIIDFQGELLLQGVHDDVDVVLLKE
ncbi:costars family protein ABRACL [Poecilia reticulata]|uniref:costars family protein ABRACL n=1 Tax=Poecilia reticulata TaxID=8081 RepID=UPI0004A25898|nr:PREDICTED: costars family protein ABRACL [Poecilia reticulata]